MRWPLLLAVLLALIFAPFGAAVAGNDCNQNIIFPGKGDPPATGHFERCNRVKPPAPLPPVPPVPSNVEPQSPPQRVQSSGNGDDRHRPGKPHRERQPRVGTPENHPLPEDGPTVMSRKEPTVVIPLIAYGVASAVGLGIVGLLMALMPSKAEAMLSLLTARKIP
jgi:hypothetical protein